MSRRERRTTINQLVHQHFLREKRMRLETDPAKMRWFLEEPLSGFLFRSSIVSGWPGVEVTVETAGDATNLDHVPELLRLEPFGSDAMFGLVRGTIRTVTFTEPREGWVFGTSGRSLPYRKAGVPGVLKIEELAKAPSYGGAAFALDMQLGPRRQAFERMGT